jgi:8-oxo-dGTP pyrophosphatase MutT (NUDIX family)
VTRAVPARIAKALVYCVANGRLLVLRHRDFPPEQVGLQVPGGTIRDDETPAAAALRELVEETGRAAFRIVRALGTADYDITPHRHEVQERHFFLAAPTEPLPEHWEAIERHDGIAPPTRLECFWIPLTSGHVLQSGHGALIGRIG